MKLFSLVPLQILENNKQRENRVIVLWMQKKGNGKEKKSWINQGQALKFYKSLFHKEYTIKKGKNATI